MSKKISVMIAALLLMLASVVPAFSATTVEYAEIPATVVPTTDDGFEYEVEDNKVTITDYSGDASEIVIPEKIEGYPVTALGYSAINYCDSVKSITIPACVEEISSQAIYWCDSLTEIKVDKNNKVYDSRENCNAIIETKTNSLIIGCEGTVIPKSVTSIGEHAFYYCEIESVELSSNIKSIGDYAFYGTDLTSITIPHSVESIGEKAFSACEYLYKIKVDKNNSVYDSREDCNEII